MDELPIRLRRDDDPPIDLRGAAVAAAILALVMVLVPLPGARAEGGAAAAKALRIEIAVDGAVALEGVAVEPAEVGLRFAALRATAALVDGAKRGGPAPRARIEGGAAAPAGRLAEVLAALATAGAGTVEVDPGAARREAP